MRSLLCRGDAAAEGGVGEGPRVRMLLPARSWWEVPLTTTLAAMTPVALVAEETAGPVPAVSSAEQKRGAPDGTPLGSCARWLGSSR